MEDKVRWKWPVSILVVKKPPSFQLQPVGHVLPAPRVKVRLLALYSVAC
jgi:hypothetical protein